MSNETGKDIYKEYLCKWVDTENLNDMVKLNESYLLRELSFKDILKNRGKECTDMIDFHDDTYEEIKRAPKTQMIGEREVVAPRYDMPELEQYMYWFDRYYSDGIDHEFHRCMIEEKVRLIVKFGWFDNKPDCLAYAKAHREVK